MRATLIIFQATVLSLLAVVGATGDSDQDQTCPLSSAKADRHCHE